MISAFVKFCLHRRPVALAVVLAVSAYGFYSARRLSVEAYPDIGDVTARVITQYSGHAAEEVEKQITIPLERELNGIPGLHVMRSRSTFALSIVDLVFEDGTEDYFQRQRVQERISEVELPEGVRAVLQPLTSPTGEIYRYTVESNLRDARELRDLHDWVVMRRLKQVAGVCDISPFGGESYQFQALIDPDKLAKHNVALREVTEAIEAGNANAGGSILVRGEQSFVVRGLGTIQSLQDLENVVVTQKNGTPVFVRDLGRCEMGVLERKGIFGKDDNDDAVSGIILMLRGSNPSVVLEGIHRQVGELNTKILPPDVKVVPYLDRTELVETTLRTVTRTLLEGMGLVVIVMILFLGNLRGALLVSLTIPFSLLFAFAMMHWTNIPANLLSLGAIDFGIIVNASIILMEVILRRREQQPGEVMSEDTAFKAALEVARPIFFGTLIIIMGYLPLFAFERVEKKLFTPMAFTIGYALVGGLLFALAAIPAMTFLTYRKKGKSWRNPVFEWLRLRYDAVLARIVKRPGLAIWPGVGAAVLAAVMAFKTGREFLPYLDEGSIWIQVEMPAGISIEKATEMSRDFRRVVREFPEVSFVATQTGRTDDGTDPWSFSHIESCVGLKPYSQWGGDKQALIKRMGDKLRAEVPGMKFSFAQPIIDMVYDMIAGAHSELVVKLYGENLDEARPVAEKIVSVLQGIPGAVDVAIDQEPPLPQVQIKIDRMAAARHGISVADISDFIETAIGGRAVTSVYVGEKSYDVAVRFIESARGTPESLGHLTIAAPNGARIPLSQLAGVKLSVGESMITREMGRRHLTIKLNLSDRDLASFFAEARKTIEEKVEYNHEKYDLAWGGSYENQQRAQSRMLVIIPAVLGLIFLLLFVAFGHARMSLVIMLTVPLSLLGGFAALWLRGMTLNVSSAVGFIALFGVVVENGVIMTDNINRWRAGGHPLPESVRRGARERLRPVLMMASVAALGLLPAALSRSIGSDVQRPLATVVVGGLVTATILTLVVLPAVYYVVERRFKPDAHPATKPTTPETHNT